MPRGVSHTTDFEKQVIVGAARSGIFDGNDAVDAVILAVKRQRNALADDCGALVVYADVVWKSVMRQSRAKSRAGEK